MAIKFFDIIKVGRPRPPGDRPSRGWTRSYTLITGAIVCALVAIGVGVTNQALRTKRLMESQELRLCALEKREPAIARYLTAIRLLSEARPGGSRMSAADVAEVARVIVQECTLHRDIGLTESIVFGLIERESGFDPGVLSSANAYGLTQLIWTTAEPHYREMGFQMLSRELLFNPVLNVEAGIRELVRLRRMFLAQGVDSWHVVLTAYYWGEKWAWVLLTKESSTLASLPSLEYGRGVLALADKWKERGL